MRRHSDIWPKAYRLQESEAERYSSTRPKEVEEKFKMEAIPQQ
jgi:hypothetical protein